MTHSIKEFVGRGMCNVIFIFLLSITSIHFTNAQQVLVAGTTFDPLVVDATKTYYGITEIEQYGLQSGVFNINHTITPDGDPGTFRSGQYYAVADNPINVDPDNHEDWTGTEDYGLILSPSSGSGQTYFTYTVNNLTPGSNYSVEVDYCNPTDATACVGQRASFRGVGNPDAFNTGNGDESTQLQPGQCATKTYTQANGNSNVVDADGRLTFYINSMNSNACNINMIRSIEVYAIPNPEIYSADGDEVCVGEQITVQSFQQYNGDYTWQVNDGSGWTDFSTSDAAIYETTSVGTYQFRLQIDYNSTIITSETIVVEAITCCEINGVPASRQTIYYDNFGRVDMSDPSGSTYYVWDYSDVLNPVEVQKTTSTPFRWELDPPPYPDLGVNTAVFKASGPPVDGEYTVAGVLTSGYSGQPITYNGLQYDGAKLEWASHVTGPSTQPQTEPRGYDHSGEIDGGVLLINNPANTGGEVIYRRTIDNLCFGKQLFFETWITVFTSSANGPYNPVDVTLRAEDSQDASNVVLVTGSATNQDSGGGTWVKLSGQITLTDANSQLIFELINNVNTDQNGNDLAIDDIKVMACSPPGLNIFFDLATLSTAEDVCSDPINLEASGSALLADFFGGAANVRYLFQWSTTPNDVTSWTNYGTPQTSATYPIADPISDPAFAASTTNGDQVYFRVIAASPDVFAASSNFTTEDANVNDPCRNYSISEAIVATVDCPACSKPSAIAFTPTSPQDFCEGDDFTGAAVNATTSADALNGAFYISISKDGGAYSTPFSLGVTQNPSGTIPAITGLTATDGGTYTVRIEDGNVGNAACYTEEDFVINVDAQPDLTATDPAAECTPNTVDITGAWSDNNAANTTGAVITYHDGTPAAPANAITNQAAITTTDTYYVLSTNGECSDEVAVDVTINESPTFTVTDPADQCAGTVDLSTTVSALSPGAATLTYHSDAAGTSANVNPVSATGTYYIKAVNAGCETIEEVNVVIDEQPDITIAQPAEVCAPNTVDISGVWTDNNTTGASITYHDAIGSTPTTNLVADETAIPTTGTYYVLATNGTCSDEAAVTVTVNPLPAKPTTTNFTFCENEALGGAVITDNVTATGSLNWYTAAGGPLGSAPTLSTTTPGTTGYGVSQTDGNSCEGDTAMIYVTVNPLPTPVISTPSAMCEGDVQTVSVTTPNATSTYAWSVTGAGVSDNGSTTGSIDITAGTGNITVEVTETDDNGCQATSATATIVVDELPPAASVDAATLNVCVVDPISLNGNAAAPGTGTWIKEAGSSATATINTPSSPTSSVTMLGGDVLIATWTITSANGHCPATDATVTVNATAVADPTANLAVDVATICSGDAVTFTATGNNLGSAPTFEFIEAGNPSNVLQADGPSNTYTTGALTADLSVEVIITSNSSCVTPGNESVTSTAVDVTVVTPATADITGYNDGDTHTTPNTSEGYTAADPGTGYTGTWSLDPMGTTATKVDAGLGTTLSNLEKDMPVELCWTVQDDPGVCASADECITIENKDLTTPVAGPDDVICVTALPYTRAGNGPSVDPVLETFAWSDDDGAGADVTTDLNEVVIPVGTTPGTYTFTFTITNSVAGSASESFTLTIIDPATADITGFNDGDPHTTPNTSEGYTAADPGTGYTGTWSLDPMGTTATKVDAGLGTTVSNLEKDMPVELCWSVQDDGAICPAATECIDIINRDITGAQVSDQTICEEDLPVAAIAPLSLPNTSLNEEAEWTEENAAAAGTIVSEDPTTHVLTLNITAAGTYQYRYRIFNPTILDGSGAPIESSVVMTVQVNATPTATISGAATICDDGSTTNIDISASGSTGPWTVGYDYDNGTTVLGQTANVTTSGLLTFSTDQDGDYTLTSVTDDVTGCTSALTGSITIGKTALPAISNITSNTATCPALTASETFTANLDAGAGPATSYNWTVNNGTILTGQGTATITVDFSGQSGAQTIEVTPVGCANGTAGTTSITVEQINDPSVSIDPISTLCFDADAKVFTADIDNSVSPSVSWSLDGTFIGAGTNTASGNTLNTFDYYDGATLRIDVTTGNTCTTTPDVFDEVVLSMKLPANRQDPTITDTNFCNIDGPLPMSEGVFVPEPGLQYNKVWYVDKGFGPQVAGVNTSTIQVNETGTYWLEVSHNICPTPTRSEEVSVVVDIQPVVNAGPEVIVEQGEYGTLEGSVIGQTDLGTGIYWSEALPEMNQYAAYTTFFGAGERIREPIVLTAINGTCRADAVTLVTIRPDIYIPKVFTPNGDPENEEWLIKNIEGYPEAKVRIFNRWGNEVWRNDKPYDLEPWDGRRNGTPMPIATYYYIIEFEGTDKEPKQGSVTILR